MQSLQHVHPCTTKSICWDCTVLFVLFHLQQPGLVPLPLPSLPELSTKAVVELDGNEGITSMTLVRFEGQNVPETSLLLAVGTAEQMTYFPTSCTAGYIRVYK